MAEEAEDPVADCGVAEEAEDPIADCVAEVAVVADCVETELFMDRSEDWAVGEYECVLCGLMLDTKPELQEHFRTHGSKSETATNAPKNALSSENIHIAAFNTSLCELCGVSCSSIRSFWFHCRKHHPDWRGVDCSHCGKHFLQRSDYFRHVEEMHKNESDVQIFLCTVCNNQFYSERALKTHLQGHEHVQQIESLLTKKESPAKKPKNQSTAFRLKASFCKLCFCQFSTSTALAQHLVTHGIFLCLTCGRELNSDLQFRNHQKIHLKSFIAIHPYSEKRNGAKVGKKRKDKCKEECLDQAG